MRSFSLPLKSILPAVALLFLVGALASNAQQNPPQTQPQPDDVVRINTDLIQTDVTVLDKQGRFVDDL
ncbi:MAG TPA: hypothetical protein VEV81_16030, partial [Pyrinomonadaceae bacterium]|nr:hypothetical protein [Pyrinomonadaceae bacterium]